MPGERRGRSKHDWLSTFLTLPHGIPSYGTYSRIFALLDPEVLEHCFSRWVQSLAARLAGEVVVIDGKTTRRSYDRWLGVPALHMVSAWAAEAQLVLGRRKTDARAPSGLACVLQPTLIATVPFVARSWLTCRGLVRLRLSLGFISQTSLSGAHGQAFRPGVNAVSGVHAPDFVERTQVRVLPTAQQLCCWFTSPLNFSTLTASEWCDLASLVWVTYERRGGNRVMTDNRCFISSLLPKAKLLLQAVRRHQASNTTTPCTGCRLG